MIAWLRRWWPLLLGLGAIALAGFLAPAPGDGEPFDPRSTAPSGTQGALDVLRELGHEVSLELDPQADVLLVLQDRLDPETRDRLRDLAEDGARLVVTDPFSPLADAQVVGQALSDPFGPTGRQPDCDWPGIADVEEVTSAAWLGISTEEDAEHACFPVGEGHALVVRPSGSGQLVVLGSAEPLTNRRLAAPDNDLLAVRLLTTTDTSSVSIVPPSPPGTGTASLSELIADRVWLALWIAAAAFVLVAWTHARRLGRPVEESMPVRVPGSELVHAIGALLQRSGAREAAARALRRRAVDDLAAATGLTVDVQTDVLIERLHVLTGEPATTLRTLLVEPITTDDGLTAVQAGLARLRDRIAAGRVPAATPPPAHDDSAPGGST